MHTIRKITTLSGKHSFTLHPSLSPYRQTELRTESQINPGWAGQPTVRPGQINPGWAG
jgi:hypothetical protein